MSRYKPSRRSVDYEAMKTNSDYFSMSQKLLESAAGAPRSRNCVNHTIDTACIIGMRTSISKVYGFLSRAKWKKCNYGLVNVM